MAASAVDLRSPLGDRRPVRVAYARCGESRAYAAVASRECERWPARRISRSNSHARELRFVASRFQTRVRLLASRHDAAAANSTRQESVVGVEPEHQGNRRSLRLPTPARICARLPSAYRRCANRMARATVRAKRAESLNQQI